MNKIIVTLVAALMGLMCAIAWSGAAGASTTSDYPNVMMVDDQGATLAAGGFNHTYGYELCDTWNDNVNPGHPLPCPVGGIPHFNNYYSLVYQLSHGRRGTFMLDSEASGEGKPGFSPRYQVDTPAAMEHYDYLAIKLAEKYHVQLIIASVFSTANAFHQAALDAKWGAWGVDMQDQSATNDPARYLSLAKEYVSAIRAGGGHTHLFDNLSSDPGGNPATASGMLGSYEKTHSLVFGFWVEDPVWKTLDNGQPGKGCAPQGCPNVTAGALAGFSPK